MRSKGQRSRSLGTKICKKNIFFRAHLRHKWIDLHPTKTEMINGPFYTYRQIHFISGNAFFCDICL